MRKLLKEIVSIPGVTGTCIFDRQEGVVCIEPDEDLWRGLTETVGIHFARLMQMGRMNRLNIKSAHFRFDRYAVVGLPLEKGAILLAICDANANCSLVATTAAMFADDMLEDLEVPAAAPSGKEVPGEQGRDSGRVDSRLQQQLEEIEHALAAAIGPVAGMVIAEYFTAWRRKGPAVSSRLPQLITMLEEEIGDPVLTTEFREQLRHYLQA